MKYLILFVSLCISHTVNAAELYGLSLTSATRDEFRIAVKNAGVKLVQEAGVDAFYDIYEGSSVLHGASNLYIGFVKKNNKFAFAEYEFEGLTQPVLLKKLNIKYGKAKLEKGKFITDFSYSWNSNGIKISLYQDWVAYKMRLIYQNSDELAQLKAEQQQFITASKQQNTFYNEKAY